MIEFLCPEGHKIRCPAEQAGRPAKCPRCGVRFRIPTLAELGLDTETPKSETALVHDLPAKELPESELKADSKVGKPGGSVKQSGPSPVEPSEPPAPKEEQIEFLCPNGHHLHGPASLQGRAGDCPECGSRFRIPRIDETPESTDEPSEFDDGIAASSSGQPLDLLEVLEEARLSGTSGLGGPLITGPDPTMPASTGMHPLGKLFGDLWAAKGESSRVEVHLETGSVILPDGYVKNLSQHGHAVLVGNDSDGSSTLTVVPWESVSRVILRGVKQVPGEVLR